MPIGIDLDENEILRELSDRRIQRGRASLLGKKWSKRFGSMPPEVERRLKSARADHLELWALWLMDAKALDEVFSD